MKSIIKFPIVLFCILTLFATSKVTGQAVNNNTTCTLTFTATYAISTCCSYGATWSSGSILPGYGASGPCTSTCLVSSWQVSDGTNTYTVSSGTTPLILCGTSYNIYVGPTSCAVGP